MNTRQSRIHTFPGTTAGGYGSGGLLRERIAFDRASRRRFDANGFLHVSLCHISKETVNGYYGHEIPGWHTLGLDPGRIYRGYRPGAALAEAAHTFNGLPLLKEHVKDSAFAPQKDLRIGNLGTEARYNAPYLDNSLVIQDAEAIEALNPQDPGKAPKRELSASYRYDPVFEAGVFNNEPYDFIMTNIRGNHVALVEEGRAGPDVVVADANTITTRKKTMGKNILVQLKALMDIFAGGHNPLAAGAPEPADLPPGAMPDKLSGGSANSVSGGFLGRLAAQPKDELPAELPAGLPAELPGSLVNRPAGGVESGLPESVLEEILSGISGAAADIESEEAAGRCLGDSEDDQSEALLGNLFSCLDAMQDQDLALRILQAVEAICAYALLPEPEAFSPAGGEAAGGLAGGIAGDRSLIRMAMDAASASSRLEQKIRAGFKARIEAARTVRPLIGDVDPLAFDSATHIYARALALIGKPSALKDPRALKELCLLACDAKRSSTPYPVIASAAAKSAGADPAFAHLGSIRQA